MRRENFWMATKHVRISEGAPARRMCCARQEPVKQGNVCFNDNNQFIMKEADKHQHLSNIDSTMIRYGSAIHE